MRKLSFYFVMVMVLISVLCSSDDKKKDHPLIPGFKNSEIIDYAQKDYDEYAVPLEKPVGDKYNKVKTIEGKITRIAYKPPENISCLQVYKTYLKLLEKKNAEIFFQIHKDTDIKDLGEIFFELNPPYNERIGMEVYAWSVMNRSGISNFSAKFTENDTDYYVCLLAGNGYAPYTVYQLDIIEVSDLGDDFLAKPSLSDTLMEEGKVALYDIVFDTGKSEIKPESMNEIQKLAEYLDSNADIKIYIVGHTDDNGDFNNNILLSQNRAKAVASVLAADFKISESRIISYGVGPVCPVASNDTPEGREKNRRVEIVIMHGTLTPVTDEPDVSENLFKKKAQEYARQAAQLRMKNQELTTRLMQSQKTIKDLEMKLRKAAAQNK